MMTYSDLCVAVRSGNTKSVETILEEHRKSVEYDHEEQLFSDVENLKNLTPLQLAARHGHIEIVRVLVSHGFLLRERCDGYLCCNALHFAADRGHSEVVRLLLEDRGFAQGLQVKAAENGIGWLTPLHLAAQCGSQESVRLLLDCEFVDSDASSIRERLTALHMAAYYGYDEVVALLEQRMSSTSLGFTDSLGRTALHYAAEQGHPSTVSQLARSIDVNLGDDDGMTALHLASCAGHVVVVKELIQRHGADVNVRAKKRTELPESFDPDNLAPRVRLTAHFPRPRLVSSMYWNPGGFSALHFAAAYGHKDVVIELLEHSGTDLGSVDDQGLMAFEWGEFNKYGGEGLVREASGYRRMEVVELVEKSRCREKQCKGIVRGLKEGWRRMEEWKRGLELFQDLVNAAGCGMWEVAEGLIREDLDEDGVIRGCWNKRIRNAVVNCIRGEDPAATRIVLGVLIRGGAFTRDELHELLRLALLTGWDDIAEELIQLKTVDCHRRSKRGKSRGTRPRERDAAAEEGTAFEYASRKGRTDLVEMMTQRADVRRELREDRQVYVECANTTIVGAVLIAGVAFQGWLQPPAGYLNDDGKYAAVDHPVVRIFWWCNSFSYYFAVAALVVGATGAMPVRGSGHLAAALERVRRAIAVAGVLLAMSMVCGLLAFEAAGYALLPPTINNKYVAVLLGTNLCTCLLFWFFYRAYALF